MKTKKKAAAPKRVAPKAQKPRRALPPDAQAILDSFAQSTGLMGLTADLKERGDGSFLVIHVGNPTDRLYTVVNNINETLPDDNRFCDRVTLKKEGRESWLASPEANFFQRTLSERLTVGKESVKEEFFSRYISSVLGAEDQITRAANHLVTGRRGSGKSTLLVYAAKKLEAEKRPYAWIAMQAYEKRSDEKVTVEVLLELLEQVDTSTANRAELDALRASLRLLATSDDVTPENVRTLIPAVKRVLAPLAAAFGRLTIFLDDLHVLSLEFQAQFLSHLYAFARGNNIILKISAIKNLTRTWNPATRTGLQPPNDIQPIELDLNLTAPQKARDHIIDILDVNAKFAGLPSVHALCGSGVLNRLVWVSAGVPRDAIYTLLQAITDAKLHDRRVVAVADVNNAASSSAEDKLRALSTDAGLEERAMLDVLERTKLFCKEKRTNAFLAEAQNNDETFKTIQKLIDLRFLHVLSPGITPGTAARRYMALLLDFGFYVGIRAARSIELFQKELKPFTSKDLRSLPRFTA